MRLKDTDMSLGAQCGLCVQGQMIEDALLKPMGVGYVIPAASVRMSLQEATGPWRAATENKMVTVSVKTKEGEFSHLARPFNSSILRVLISVTDGPLMLVNIKEVSGGK